MTVCWVLFGLGALIGIVFTAIAKDIISGGEAIAELERTEKERNQGAE